MNQVASEKKFQPLLSSSTIAFADVAHQMLFFDTTDPTANLILSLIDTPWVQRLRNIRQTGNTHLVYMFAEHSRFGHSLGVAYLALTLMKNLRRDSEELVIPYQEAVAVAALLHDIGHVAPGSHLAERIWGNDQHVKGHEQVSVRVIREDPIIHEILHQRSPVLGELVCRILLGEKSLPAWTKSIIAGGGWNVDRGNWALVDSAMCAVSYGRYNVPALIDAFRLSQDGQLILQENRLDALIHFLVARDSMYRQVYQHRVLLAADALTQKIVLRLRDILNGDEDGATTNNSCNAEQAQHRLTSLRIFCDEAMLRALLTPNYAQALPLNTLYQMAESWWTYHLHQWCHCDDTILSDLAVRLRDRSLLKTIRVDKKVGGTKQTSRPVDDKVLIQEAQLKAKELGYDPKYYVTLVHSSEINHEMSEEPPLVLLDNGEMVPAYQADSLIARLFERSTSSRVWLAVPKKVKVALGKWR